MYNAVPIVLTICVLFILYIVFVYIPDRKKLRDTRHVFLDLETYSTRPNAAILAIGAVCVNLLGEEISRIKILVDVKDAMRNGHVDSDTVHWWDEQSDEVKRLTFDDSTDRFMLEDALHGFGQWYSHMGEVQGVWGNGATFDCSILRSGYMTVSGAHPSDCPWDFWQERDCRTVRDIALISGCVDYKQINTFKGTPHNSVDDASHQAGYTVDFIRELF